MAASIVRAHGRITPFLKMRVKPGEQRIHRLRPDQVFAQQPDRPRVSNQPMQVETGKAHETRPVPGPKPGPLIRRPLQALQHKHLEHHHRIHRRATALRTIGPQQ